MTAIRAAAESHTGYIRSNNEDLAVVSGDLVAVADGMGGHLGGEVAARTAIEELVEAFQRDRTAPGLVAAVRRANRAIWRTSRVDRKLHGMGTTLTAVALVPALDREGNEELHLALVNVGDSRAYRLDRARGDAPDALFRLTEDHSVVEEMVRQGELTPAEASVHPHRHVLTRVLGMDAEVELDMWDIEPREGSRFLLCSDGLTNEVPEDEIAAVLAAAADPRSAARELIGRALGHGGIDNVTVVVADIVEGGIDGDQPVEMVPPRPPMPDSGDGRFGEDITQAVPVTRAAGRRRGRRPAEAPVVVPPLPADAPDPSPQTSSPPDLAAGSTAEVAAVDLAESGPPTEAHPMARPDGVEPTDRDGSAAATGLTAGLVAGEVVTGEVVGHTPRRTGRSMTVRGAATAATAASVAGGGSAGSSSGSPSGTNGFASPGSHGARSTVLVPTRSLSKRYRDRIVTVRVFIFLTLLVGLFAGVIAVVVWFQKSSYYVGLHHGRVSIYQGRPGGLLWFKPQLLDTSAITTANLLPNSIAEVKNGIEESSYPAARQEITDLTNLSNQLGIGPAGPTTTTTTTSPVTITIPSTTIAVAATSPPPTTKPTTPTTTKSAPASTTSTTRPVATSTTSPSSTSTTSPGTTIPNHAVAGR